MNTQVIEKSTFLFFFIKKSQVPLPTKIRDKYPVNVDPSPKVLHPFFLQNFDSVVSEEELDKMINNVDKDGDGGIDFKEFIALMENNFKRQVRMPM